MLTNESFMPAEAECAETLREIRWADGIYCPDCESTNVKCRTETYREHCLRQEYTLAAPLRDEIGLLLRRVAAGETLAEVLSTSAESERYDGTHIYSRLLFHLGQATEEYLGPAKMAELLETFLEVATLVRDTQRTLDARIAQAKYARWIVAGLLPTVTLLLMRLAPEFGSHLLYHPAGNVALGLAALLAVLAFGIGKRLARLEPLKF